jgi:hypothetical protein
MNSQPACDFRARLLAEALEDRLAPATFTVTSTGDNGAGSLRTAITQANAHAGADTIAFAIGSGQHQIRIATALPAITDPVVINGRTQPGFSGVPLILVNGFDAGAGVNGLVIEAGGSGSTVVGLGINQFNGDAILIRANNVHVVGNYIGILHTGLEELSNAGNGVHIQGPATGNVIGSVHAAGRNVISGNDTNGVLIAGEGARGNVVLGNYIGTNASGSGFVGNGVADTASLADGAGIRIAGGASGNVIGGTAAGARNVISANTEYGVNIDGANGNVVLGNYIGTNASGSVAFGNFEDGVRIVNGSSGNVIGGTTVAARNVISGNGANGVDIAGTLTRGNHIRGNRIGAAAVGGVELGNGEAGVKINADASFNAVGGPAATAGNIIAFNHDTGVRIDSGTGNTVLSNRLIDNVGPGIDLQHNGVTPNDPNDSDAGANGLINFPELSFARLIDSGLLRIVGSINVGPNKTLRIEFFASAAADPSGHGEGEKFLGYLSLRTGEANTASFATRLAVSGVHAGDVLTATVTDELGNTSEFSLARTII